MVLKEQILSHKDFPKTPKSLRESVINEGHEYVIDLSWRGRTEVITLDFINSLGNKMFYYFYLDIGNNLIEGTFNR